MDLGAAGAALLRVGGGEITALTEEVHKLVAALRADTAHRAPSSAPSSPSARPF